MKTRSAEARCAGLAHVTHVPHFLFHLMAGATDASPLASKPSSFCSLLYRLISFGSTGIRAHETLEKRQGQRQSGEGW
jgi:hypothetical protein